MPRKDKIKYLIIHTSSSAWGSVDVIRDWHTLPPPKGRGWADIGYHYVITNGFLTYDHLKKNTPDAQADGHVWPGRDLDHDGDVEEEVGAHCVGYNDKSLGICLVGSGGKYTKAQLESLYSICLRLMTHYNIPVDNVLGHYETPNGKSQGKSCPDLDMVKIREMLAFLLRVGPATCKG